MPTKKRAPHKIAEKNLMPIEGPSKTKSSNKRIMFWITAEILGLLFAGVPVFDIYPPKGMQTFAYGLILAGIWGIVLSIPNREDRSFRHASIRVVSFVLGLLNVTVVIGDMAIGNCSAPIDSFMINSLGLNIFYLHFGGIGAGLIGLGGDRTKIVSTLGLILTSISFGLLVTQVIKCNPFA